MRPHEDEHPELDLLRDELHQLERRVDALEHHSEPATLMAEGPVAASAELLFTNAIPVAGRAILGLAGAYVLRALAESGAAPRLLMVVAAILYAGTWLLFSFRAHGDDSFASTAYGVTSVLILVPLLWEATVRFDVLPPASTAAILVAFMVLTSALAWQRNRGAVASVTTLSIVLTAIALMIRTGNLVPFVAALLATACIVEAGGFRGHASRMRVPVALATDFAIWLLLYVMSRPGGVPQDYKTAGTATSAALCATLFLIYATSVAWHAVARRHAITVFEIGQVVVAFALAACGVLQVTDGKAAPPIGALCAVVSAACYFAAFVRFADSSERNHHVFASLGLALGLLSCFLILPGSLLTVIWSVAAVIATLAGARTSLRSLRIHGTLYLLAAGLISGVPGRILNAFTGSALEPATSALWIMAISAACCYAAWGRAPARASLVPALFATVSVGALLLQVALSLIGKPTASLLATARTLITCGLALALGFTGWGTGRRELVWISYVAVALGTVKLVLEDFRQSHAAALAVSLICYGALLILMPKLSRRSF